MSAVPVDRRVDEFDAFVTTRNLRSTPDTTGGRTRICARRDLVDITEQVFDPDSDTPQSEVQSGALAHRWWAGTSSASHTPRQTSFGDSPAASA